MSCEMRMGTNILGMKQTNGNGITVVHMEWNEDINTYSTEWGLMHLEWNRDSYMWNGMGVNALGDPNTWNG